MSGTGDRIREMAIVAVTAVALASAFTIHDAVAQASSVVNTVHNLSVSGPGEVRALSETQVCKFCHIPHNAIVAEPLWGHALSVAQYKVPGVRDRSGVRNEAPQPDGSSRLCLSCHDGTVALGDVGGAVRPIAMAGPNRLGPDHRGFLGTDLSGSHPISFIVEPSDPSAFRGDRDMVILEVDRIRQNTSVRLDARGKMQCTTCHDPHSDVNYEEGVTPRFWVMPTVDEVCLTCHALF